MKKRQPPIKVVLMVVVFLATLFLMAYDALARTPIDYNKWDLGDGRKAIVLGGLDNYPDTDSTFAPIDNTLLTEGDSVLYNNTSILKTRINKNGQVKIQLTWNDVTYEIRQKPIKLIWINTQTKNWTDVIPNLSWGIPTVNTDNVVWSFPGFNYSLHKNNARVSHRVTWKKGFLDSAVVLFNWRTDSANIALGSVMEYSFVNIDDSTLIDVAEVSGKTLKRWGKKVFGITKQRVWCGDESVELNQRWIKQGGKIYCIEFVKMGLVKDLHEQYPNKPIWHNTVTEITFGNIEDTYMGSNEPTVNKGTDGRVRVRSVSITRHGLVRYDLSGIGSDQKVDSTATYWFRDDAGSADGNFFYHECTQAWVELEATWNIYSTGNNWTSAGGDFDATAYDSVTHFGHDQSPGTGDGDASDSVWTLRGATGGVSEMVEDWIDGTKTNNGMLITPSVSTTAIASTDDAGESIRPRLYIEHSDAGAPTPVKKRRRKIILMGDNNETNHIYSSLFTVPHIDK